MEILFILNAKKIRALPVIIHTERCICALICIAIDSTVIIYVCSFAANANSNANNIPAMPVIACVHTIKSQTLANVLKLQAIAMYSRAPKSVIYHLKSPRGISFFFFSASALNSQSMPLILCFLSKGIKITKRKRKSTSKYELETKMGS